ncbi:FACT complex subunit ctc-1 [Cyphellophora attinorum]|uniref:FACT complex subunit POB3 n=1 Tax=Cyphellophora attinorum TaxID=1664694 RepID=A0A0N1H3J9_9EURO|nr:FACT complex subunit ctc-1 [Phialophora attinorum]KPI39470.1 FACT complex subunit ctc-1 [Phialophora attinorum]
MASGLTYFRESFENIHLDLSKQSGRCRLAESGLGWKAGGSSAEPFTLSGDQLLSAQWSRAAKGHELKIITKEQSVIQLDGFVADDFERVSKAFKIWYGINLENKEHALRGWNWGKAEFGRAEMAFNVQNRPAFEIPYSEISNTNLAGRNEIAVEFNLTSEQNGVNGHKPATTRERGRKAAAARDELVEMRFYIPGTMSKKEANGDEGSFRLRGKTYDYKVEYSAIKKVFMLPKIDEVHTLLTLGLDPPLRQGQTRYPFLVMQIKLDDETQIDLNLEEDVLATKYKDKLEGHYEAPLHHVITRVFKGLSGKKVITPSKDFSSHHNLQGVKCSIKANEGALYCLDRSFMFVPKPATYVPIENVEKIVMSRIGGQLAASRTFDISILLKGGAGEHQFSNINREEQQSLEEFFKAKGIKYKNEMTDDSSSLLKAALEDQDLASSEETHLAAAARTVDSESDVAEEYDSEHESSGAGSGSDVEMADADDGDDDDGDAEEEERPKKKSKK